MVKALLVSLPLLLPMVALAAADGPAQASASAGAARAALTHFVDNVHTLQADFTQVQTDDTGAIVKSQSGRMWLSRPGQFRWNYEKPYTQVIVCDGHNISVYDPDLQQVTVRPAAKVLAGSPAALLSGRGTLTESFRLNDGGARDGLHVVELLPKSAHSDFKSVQLSLRDGVPVRMVFHDQLGDSTDIRFTHIQVNKKLDAGRFKFVPPKGVTVVGSEAPDTD